MYLNVQGYTLCGTNNTVGDVSVWYNAYNEGTDAIQQFIWNNLPESNKVLVTSVNFSEDDAKRLKLREVIKFQDTTFVGNSFVTLWNHLQKSNLVRAIFCCLKSGLNCVI